ncbi:MAG TPA: PCRF domain-containing protein, partial [Hydrogenothermaceae bacterium]|nr:PCRF domain-containing protein [Hydrogenothermaceae bacterium]
KPEMIEKRLKEIEKLENDINFWNNPKESSKVQKEKNSLIRKLEKYKKAKSYLDDNKDTFELASLEIFLLDIIKNLLFYIWYIFFG